MNEAEFIGEHAPEVETEAVQEEAAEESNLFQLSSLHLTKAGDLKKSSKAMKIIGKQQKNI